MSALIDVEINVDKNTKKRFTISINDTKTKAGNNVVVFVPQTEEEQRTKQRKEIIGAGRVFWTNGKIETAEKCDEWVDK
jgi:hypothetical protein